LRQRALRPQLKRDPLGAYSYPGTASMRFVFRAGRGLQSLFLLTACHAAPARVGLDVVYPALLRQAQVSGFYQFRVPIDSAGRPQVSGLQVLSSPNPGFDWAVRRALATWRPPVAPGTQAVEHTILFLILPPGSDSVEDCPRSRAFTVVCAVAPRAVRMDVR